MNKKIKEETLLSKIFCALKESNNVKDFIKKCPTIVDNFSQKEIPTEMGKRIFTRFFTHKKDFLNINTEEGLLDMVFYAKGFNSLEIDLLQKK